VAATLDDIAVVNRLAHQVLGRTLDELSLQTRRLLMLLDHMVSEGFTNASGRCARSFASAAGRCGSTRAGAC